MNQEDNQPGDEHFLLINASTGLTQVICLLPDQKLNFPIWIRCSESADRYDRRTKRPLSLTQLLETTGRRGRCDGETLRVISRVVRGNRVCAFMCLTQ